MPEQKQFARNRADVERLTLVVVEGPQYHVRAHYNPSEVQFERTISWSAAPQPGAGKALDYQGDAPRTMSLDLFLDCFEIKDTNLTADLESLARMTVATDPSAKDDFLRRAPVIEILNGPITGFRCVINSISVKATAFDTKMQPVRATVSIKVTEVTGHAGTPLDEAELKRGSTRMNYLAWTKAEVDGKIGEAYREQDWRARPKK